MNKTISNHTVVLHLGSNNGLPKENLALAINYIKKEIGFIIKKSSYYQTAAWGKTNQPDFINIGLVIETSLTPTEVLRKALSIETKMGRIRKEKWGQRIIDIDIIFYDHITYQSNELNLPHIHAHQRAFVLIPLKEIIPDYIHPTFKKTVIQLLQECNDPLEVKRL